MLDALQMSPFGALHTLIGLAAVVAGIVSLARFQEISLRSLAGQVYVIATVLTCATGLGIFHHGGFGKPHALAIVTLIVLTVAVVADRERLFGRVSRYVEVIAYSTTFFFHMIPAVNETATRLPIGAPLAAAGEAAALQVVAGLLFLVLLAGLSLQIRRLRTDIRIVPSEVDPVRPQAISE